MLKDITYKDFWTLVRMGYDMQKLYDANYVVDENEDSIIYLDYKQYIPRALKGREDKKKKDKGNNQTQNKKHTENGKNSDSKSEPHKTVKKLKKPNITKMRMFDYTRYKINLTKRRQQKFLTVRMPDKFDYDNYFKNTGLPIK